MRQKTTRNLNGQLQDIIQKYIDAGFAWPASMKVVAKWACDEELYQKPAPSMVEIAARDLARAARQEYITDVQGRRVRRFHAFRPSGELGEDAQPTLWGEIYTLPPKLMELSLQQRRSGIVGDCKQLKTDADSYNDNNPQGAEIQLSFDFRDDMADLEQPTEYDPGTLPEEDEEI